MPITEAATIPLTIAERVRAAAVLHDDSTLAERIYRERVNDADVNELAPEDREGWILLLDERAEAVMPRNHPAYHQSAATLWISGDADDWDPAPAHRVSVWLDGETVVVLGPAAAGCAFAVRL